MSQPHVVRSLAQEVQAAERLLKLADAAYRLNVDVETIRRYIRKGALKATRLPSGHYRVTEAALKECQGCP